MNRILSEIYNDDYSVQQHAYQPDLKYHEILEKTSQLEKELLKELPEELKQKFIAYQDTSMHLSSLTGEMYFKEGFRLGVRLMVAALEENMPTGG